MFNKSTLSSLVLSMAVASPVFSEEDATESDLQKFAGTELLVQTLTADDQAVLDAATEDAPDLTEAEQAVTDAATTVNEAIAAQEDLADDATEEDIAAAQQAVDDANLALEDANLELQAAEDAEEQLATLQGDVAAEIAATEELVGELSEEQVIALNRSLNNAADGKLLVDIDTEDLQQVIDGEYNNLQINAFTQSFEQEARFLQKADRFTSKYEETGNEKFLDHATRMEERGETQKAKFAEHIDRFANSPSTEAGQLAKQEAKASAKSAAKESAQGAAKQAAKGAAKQAAKGAAKQAAKDVARQVARGTAKKAAKGAAKKAAKNNS